jgi:hypothetical protein
MNIRRTLAVWAGLVVMGVASSASGDKIIADMDLCGTTSTAGEVKCCRGDKCHSYSGCSAETTGQYAGAWRCSSVIIRCGAGSGNNLSKCRVMRKAKKIKGPGKPPTKSPPKKGPTKRPSKKS